MAFSIHSLFTSLHPQISPSKKPHIYVTDGTNTIVSFSTAPNWINARARTQVSTSLHKFNLPTEYGGHNGDIRLRHAQKLKEARSVFSKVAEDPFQSLIMIDALQRLGIDYLFQEDIKTVLKNQYRMFSSRSDRDYDLCEVALRFRLLRQEGSYVPVDLFNNFKNKEGKIDQELGQDIKGLIELYEASQLGIEGETILDEARDFSGQLLNAWMAHHDGHQAVIVSNTLKHPYHRSLARFMVKNLLNNFQVNNEYNDIFMELAKVDFNIVQSIHQQETVQVSNWWKNLGLGEKLKFARDQPLKWYTWPMAVLTHPTLSEQRMELTKPISLVYIIDDIFDLRGTLDELVLFAEAVNRWEIEATERLPYYMKICFKALYDITNEISYKLYKKHGWNPIDTLRKEWARLCNAFLVEAKWFASGHLPKSEEYLKNGIVSTGVPLVLVHIFFLVAEGITKESVDLVDEIPGIISSVATILRLWDDLGSAKDENQEGHDGSYVKCYLKEHPTSSVQEARDHVMHMISDAWKQLNQECLSPNPFSTTFTKSALNSARMVPLMYAYDDNHNLPNLEELMKSLLFESVSV